MAERKRKLDIVDESAAKRSEVTAGMGTPAGINPYTGKSYSKRYYDILEKRTGEGLQQAKK
jgi:pre-mRNA-splicing factor ATP-dependent RNA helicase DHX15/PRP43